MVEGCNWLMVGIAAGWLAYVLASSFSSPANSQAIWLPPPVVQPVALPVEAAVGPIGEPLNIDSRTSGQDTDSRQGRAANPSSGASTTSSSDERPPKFWVQAPEVPIPPLTPMPPGVGPDF